MSDTDPPDYGYANDGNTMDPRSDTDDHDRVTIGNRTWFKYEGLWCFQGDEGPVPAAIETGTIIPVLLTALAEARTRADEACSRARIEQSDINILAGMLSTVMLPNDAEMPTEGIMATIDEWYAQLGEPKPTMSDPTPTDDDAGELLAEAIYGPNPDPRMATGLADLLPLITATGGVWCEGSHNEGHVTDGYVMCAMCGAMLTHDLSGIVLPHWRWTLDHVLVVGGGVELDAARWLAAALRDEDDGLEVPAAMLDLLADALAEARAEAETWCGRAHPQGLRPELPWETTDG